MAISQERAIQFFERALETEIGIFIRTDDPKAFRAELLDQQRKLSPKYDELTTALPAGNTQVWVMKKGTEL